MKKTELIGAIFPEFSNWVENNKNRRNWIDQALEQMDRWRDANLKIHPALLFALLFGEYHEALIDSKINKGINPFDASREAVHKHLSLICEQVRIPKTVIYKVCDIMTNQHRFKKIKGKQPKRFMQSSGFLDAFLYLKFSAKNREKDIDILEFWTKFRCENPIKRAPQRTGPRRRNPSKNRK